MSVLDRPFPLLQRFERLVLPPLLLSLGLFLWSVYAQNKTMGERVYVKLEKNHLQAVLDDELFHDDQLRNILLSSEEPSKSALLLLANLEKRTALESSAQDYLCLAFVRPDGSYVAGVSLVPDCRALDQEILVQIASEQHGTIIEDFPHQGVWSVVVPLSIMGKSSQLFAVATKASQRIQNDLHLSFKLWAAAAFLALSIAILVAWVLIRIAQKMIAHQVRELIRLRDQLSRYVSEDTVRAIMVSDKNDLPSSRSNKTLLFMDVRDFSGYAETANLDDIASLLNDITSIATIAAAAHRGDVNKVVGDGVLITFSGNERQTRALQAAVDIVENITSGGYARNVGLGVHDGEVISATVGRGKRRDHTVLGRAVNQAARLCSMAGPGEIVASVGTVSLESTFDIYFSPEENVFLKGHTNTLQVRKYRPYATK